MMPPRLVGRSAHDLWLEWPPLARCSEYELQTRGAPVGFWSTVSVAPGSGVQLRGLSAGRELQARVRGRCAASGLWDPWSPPTPVMRTLPRPGHPAPRHLAVLVPDDDVDAMNLLAETLAATFPDTAVHVSRANADAAKRLGGIVAAGQRLSHEVMAALAVNPEVEAVSFVCRGLGGLFARAALRPLGELGKLDAVELLNFVTIGTPHLGTRAVPDLGLAALVYQTTARELMRRDDPPALALLTTRPYVQPLARFRRRLAYASVHPDARFEHYSTALRTDQPYAATVHSGAQPYWDLVETRRDLEWPVLLRQGGGASVLAPTKLPPQPDHDEDSVAAFGGAARRGVHRPGRGGASSSDDDDDSSGEEEIEFQAPSGRTRAASRAALMRDGSSVAALAEALQRPGWHRADVVERDIPTAVSLLGEEAALVVAHITAHMLTLSLPVEAPSDSDSEDRDAAEAGAPLSPASAGYDTEDGAFDEEEGVALMSVRSGRPSGEDRREGWVG